jgi:predicted TIM-barrel fold metal-dependent hydrolase
MTSSSRHRWNTIDRYMILTSDSHAGASTDGYRPYLAPRWHDDYDRWVASIRNPWVDLRDPERAKLNWDADARTAVMDAEGITGEIIFPNTLPPFFDILAHLSGVPRTAAELAPRWAGLQAHNRWLVDFCAATPGRRRGLIQLLPNDIDAAVAELEWAKGTGAIAGAMIPAVPPNHVVEPYFHERYERLWAACAALELPLHQHQGTGAPDVAELGALGQSIFFTELDLWTRRTLLHLIVGGVFERHPTLQVVWTEMWGLRWAIEDLERMTRRLGNVQTRFAADPSLLNYAQTFGSPEVDSLLLTPIEYFRRNCSIGASMLPRHEVRYRHVLGVDRIMWGNDFPHPEGTWPLTTEALRYTLFDVPEDECREMLAGNAARLYGFDLDALTEVAAAIGPPVTDVHDPLLDRPTSPSEAFAMADELQVALG